MPIAIGAEEVHLIAQKDEVGEATFLFELSEAHNSPQMPKCPMFLGYAMATKPMLTRVQRHATEVVWT
jgi:hypothetical protein